MSIHSWHRKTAVRIAAAALVLATAVLVSLGAIRPHTAPAAAPVTLAYWVDSPLDRSVIPAFERTHPGIKIHEVVVTASRVKAGKKATVLKYSDQVRTMLQTGQAGAPDALEAQFKELPSYLLTGKLLDLSPYGAGSLKDTFVPWAWGQVTRGSHVYAMPIDSGPVAMMYRKDIFNHYHLAIPTTWAQYEQEAITLHRVNPKLWMGNSPADEYDFEIFLWQAGVTPFNVNGRTISVDWTSPAAMRVANYWYRLVKEKAVATIPADTPSWYTALDNGTFATWINASWAPAYASKSSGKWRVALMPQWSARDHAAANYGGASAVVTTYSKHPREAAAWVEWLGTSKTSQLIALKDRMLPTLTSTLTNPNEVAQPDPFFGGQKANTVFAQASTEVLPRWQYSPFNAYVSKRLNKDFAAAEKGKGTFAHALKKLQASVVAYARSQGFTVR